MSILVTGGFGFIGKEVVRQLSSQGNHVISFGRRVTAEKTNLNVSVIKGDVAEKRDVERVFEKYSIDKVVHLAYAMDIWGDNPKATIDVNVGAFVNIMEACVYYNVKRIVWSSSVMVYGRPNEYTGRVNEDSITNPDTFYGNCKKFDEYISNHYSEKFGIDSICLRPTTVYGPGRYARGAAAFLYDIALATIQNKHTELYLGLSKTDLVHVKDVARAFTLAIEAKNNKSKIYNISGFEIDAHGLLGIIREINNEPPPVTLLPNENNRFPSKIDRSLAKKELDYEPHISLKEGVKEYIKDFNPNIPISR
ncbi:MAG TPA: NAD(P)-dependent oxidoreductase [Pseudogracilibacillus sp.]|nr:NAD(P)-dependent oxidoreductase [Pseudogracilibacillus sp.]